MLLASDCDHMLLASDVAGNEAGGGGGASADAAAVVCARA